VHIPGLDNEAPENAPAPVEQYSDPLLLTKQILTPEQRNAHLQRIVEISENIPRLEQEKVFIDALLFKVKKIQELLEGIDKLHPAIEDVSSDNLDEGSRQVIIILERRRQLVTTINRINPSDVSNLLAYDVDYVKSRAALRELTSE